MATRKSAARKKPSTKAGKYVRKEIRHVRRGKHGARNTKQAIAIGLSKARRAGVKVPKKRGTKRGKKRSVKRGAKRKAS